MKYIIKTFIQINILIKRMLCRPAMIVVLLLMPALLLSVRLLPEKKQSTRIVSGIYIDSPDDYTDRLINNLTSNSTGFTFEVYNDLEKMKDDTASGKIDSSYMIPAGFSTFMISPDRTGNNLQITVYVTPGSSFQSVTQESVYAAFLSTYAADMSVNMLEERYMSNVAFSGTKDYAEEYINDRFQGYIDNNDIFSIQGGLTGKYVSPDQIVPNNFPVNLLIYMIIFISALLGAQNYLKDLDEGIYSVLSRRSSFSFCIKNIAAGIIPTAITAFISMLIYMNTSEWLYILLHIIAVSVLSLIAATIVRFVIRRYKAFTISMPFMIICILLPLLLSQLSQL